MSRRRITLDRRRFLTAVGATGLTLSFLRALPSYAAGVDKRYLILLFTPNGVVRHLWGADSTGTNPGDFTLRPWLAPLTPYKDKLAIVYGLANKAANGGSHGPGMATLWTGATVSGDGNFGTGESIDQAIAAQLNAGTPFPSISLRARSPLDYDSKDTESRMIYSAPGQPVDPREDVLAALDELFVGIPDVGSTTTTPTVDPAITRRDEIRKRLYARLDGELGRLSPKLCSDDAHQLDALRSGWAALTQSLGRSGPGADASSACGKPTGLTGNKDYKTAIKEQMDLLTMALACDLTRVASLQLSAARSPMVFDFLGQTLDHHSISHQAPQPSQLGPNAPITTDAEHPTAAQLTTYAAPIKLMTDVNVFYAQQVAYLVQKLSQFQVDSTTTLLDQCIICWGNELDNGSNHDHFNMPFVVIGGGNGKIKTNQIVSFPVADPYRPLSEAQYAHNDLLVTLAKAMGTNITTFGDPSLNKGPITALLA